MRLGSFLFVLLFARLAGAQATDTVQHAPVTNISGIVHDSIARTPLAGAIVQLLPAGNPAVLGRTAISDSLGRFTLADVPDGRYTLGFLHPMLDSLGVDAPLREVYVAGDRSLRTDLAIPSPARLRTAICGLQSQKDSSSGVLIGFVREARNGAPLAGVKVTGEWLEVSFGPGGFSRRIPRRVATTGENGWFAMCDVPNSGIVALIASRGADSTGLIEVQVPAEGFARRELFLGDAQTVVIADTVNRADTLAFRPRRVHLGDGRLSGTVVAAVGGKQLGGALVSITDGPQTRANERGEWTLVNAPVGTRMLEVRVLGYYPVRRHVDIVAGAPPIRVALSTMKAVLDTVRVAASRVHDRHLSGFEDRRRANLGRYLTPADISRHSPIVTSDLFRRVPGLYVERSSLGETIVLMRGMFSDRCSPAVYIDDHYMRELSADAIDDYVKPDRVMGIEIYAGSFVPPQFQPGLSGCGSIVIWTK